MNRIATVLLLVCVCVAPAIVAGLPVHTEGSSKFNDNRIQRWVMPWMCLERCGSTPEQVKSHLNDVIAHKDIVSKASFEMFNLGDDGELIFNANLTSVHSPLREAGIDTLAMVSSYPYPPQFMHWMRKLWQTDAGDKFIAQLIEAGRKFKLSGFNIDFEPTKDATAQDGHDYALFLNKTAGALHDKGLLLSVDVASWSPVWSLPALRIAQVDYIMTMDTYTSNFTTFQERLWTDVDTIGERRLVVGLSSTNLTSTLPMTYSEYQERLWSATASDVHAVAVWDEPITRPLWLALRQWANYEPPFDTDAVQLSKHHS